MNMETAYELSIPTSNPQPLRTFDGEIVYTGDNEPLNTPTGNADVKEIASNNKIIWERAIPIQKSGETPLSFRATRAKPLLEWSITGKTYQAWTPSPEPQVGNNKLDNSKIEKSSTITNFTYTDSSVSFGSLSVGSTINSAEIKAEDTLYAFSFSGDSYKTQTAIKCYDSSHTYLGDANMLFFEGYNTVFSLLSNTAYIRLVITILVQGIVDLTNLMLNKGGTLMAFEPFKYLPNTGVCQVQGVGDYDSETGEYKISVSSRSGGQEITTPIYLNSPLMADEVLKSDGNREVKWGVKVFDGSERIARDASKNAYRYAFTDLNDAGVPKSFLYCSHFKNAEPSLEGFDGTINTTPTSTAFRCWIWSNNFDSLDSFKSFLSSEYAKGTPVTVYYQLATSTSETVSVPRIPTFKGNCTIDVDTEVQPTNMTAVYLGKDDENILFTLDKSKLNGREILK